MEDDKSQSTLKDNLKKAGFCAWKGQIRSEPLKIKELELVRDGIDFWHCLFALFGVEPYFYPYDKQPSLNEHYHLFQTLQFNHLSNPEGYPLISEKRDRLLANIRELEKKPERDFSSLEGELTDYYDTINKNLRVIENIFAFNPLLNTKAIKKKQDFEKIVTKSREKSTGAGLKGDVKTALTLLETIWEFCFRKENTQSVGFRLEFAGKFFKTNSCYWEKGNEIDIKFLNALSERYKYLSTKPNFQIKKEDLKIFCTNVVTANLYIKYGNQYESIEINYDQEPIISPLLCFPNESEGLKAVMKERFEENEFTRNIPKKEKSFGVHHSEKGLIVSISFDDRLQQLVTKFKQKIRGSQPRLSEPLKIDEIGLQIFSIRDYCYWCESFLSDKFCEQYQKIKKLLEEDGDIHVEGPDLLKKYCSSSFDHNTEKTESHLENEYKFVIDHSHKSYFNEGFLKDSSKYYQYCSKNNRTYFLSDPEDFDLEDRKSKMNLIREMYPIHS